MKQSFLFCNRSQKVYDAKILLIVIIISKEEKIEDVKYHVIDMIKTHISCIIKLIAKIKNHFFNKKLKN